MADLEGRIALVTGGSRGIGAGIARALAAAGVKVIVSDIVAPEAVAAEIGGWPRALDVTQESAWASMMSFAHDEAGGLDILVNNAGVIAAQAIKDMSLEDWRRVHSVNVEGVFLGCKYAAPLLAEPAARRPAGGVIVNISSIAALRGSSGLSAYSASKGAVVMMTKCLSLELAGQGIRVNAVLPGLIETDMGRRLMAHVAPNDVVMTDARGEPAPLAGAGSPANIGDAVVFLASDKATFMTGSEVVIDGGQTA